MAPQSLRTSPRTVLTSQALPSSCAHLCRPAPAALPSLVSTHSCPPPPFAWQVRGIRRVRQRPGRHDHALAAGLGARAGGRAGPRQEAPFSVQQPAVSASCASSFLPVARRRSACMSSSVLPRAWDQQVPGAKPGLTLFNTPVLPFNPTAPHPPASPRSSRTSRSRSRLPTRCTRASPSTWRSTPTSSTTCSRWAGPVPGSRGETERGHFAASGWELALAAYVHHHSC